MVQQVIYVFQTLTKVVVFAHISMLGLTKRLRCNAEIFIWKLVYM